MKRLTIKRSNIKEIPTDGYINLQYNDSKRILKTVDSDGWEETVICNRNVPASYIEDTEIPSGEYHIEAESISGLPGSYFHLHHYGGYSNGGYAVQTALCYYGGINQGLYIRNALGYVWGNWERTKAGDADMLGGHISTDFALASDHVMPIRRIAEMHTDFANPQTITLATTNPLAIKWFKSSFELIDYSNSKYDFKIPTSGAGSYKIDYSISVNTPAGNAVNVKAYFMLNGTIAIGGYSIVYINDQFAIHTLSGSLNYLFADADVIEVWLETSGTDNIDVLAGNFIINRNIDNQ